MPTLTEAERKGNPPAKAAKTPEPEAAPTPHVLGTRDVRTGHISAADAREIGENAVKEGALERAERHVSGFQPFPKATAQPKRIVVDREGKVIPEGAATDGGTVLVGAEAEAYEAKHGGAKEADQSANKGRKARASTKARGAKSARGGSRRKGR